MKFHNWKHPSRIFQQITRKKFKIYVCVVIEMFSDRIWIRADAMEVLKILIQFQL